MSGFVGSIETSMARRVMPLKTKYAEIAGMGHEGRPNPARKTEADAALQDFYANYDIKKNHMEKH
jgi:hypothetical protein